MAGVNVTVILNQEPVYAMVETFVAGIQDAELIALRRIESMIRQEVFDRFVRSLCRRAGDGWSHVYTDQLVETMQRNIPIFTDTTQGTTSISFDFELLGSFDDLKRSAHNKAIEAISPGQYGTTKGGKDRYTRHPPLVTLPYEGQALYNDGYLNARRMEFWKEVVVGRNMGFKLKMMKGNVPMTAADLGYIDTFDDTALARSLVWSSEGKAPQWLWLEHGFKASSVRQINPVDFSRSIELVVGCAASRIYEGSILALVKIAEDAGGAVAVGGAGRVFRAGGQGRSSGQFVGQTGRISEFTTDYHDCFGRF